MQSTLSFTSPFRKVILNIFVGAFLVALDDDGLNI